MQEVTLNGISLRAISRKIIIHDVSESAPTFAYSASDIGSGIGQIITSRKMQYRDITIKFAIADKTRDTPERGNLLDAIDAWMIHGGELRSSDRELKHINVHPLTFPARPDSHKWNQDYTIVFRSYRPYWISDYMGFIGSNDTETRYTGTAPAPVEVEGVTIASTVGITLDSETMVFTDLPIGKKFSLSFDEYDRAIAKCDDVSCLSKLTTQSADTLTLVHGVHRVTVYGLRKINISSEVRFL